MSSSRRHGQIARSLKPCVHRFLGALVVTSVLLTAMLGGQRYLYCRAMNEIMTRATCECAKAHAAGDGTASVDVDNDCFEARVIGRLVSFALTSGVTVPAATLHVVLPPSLPQPIPSEAPAPAAMHPIRAGPFSPTSARAHLMVFLT